jgi:tetratricopeptide (TPR) repeat protein
VRSALCCVTMARRAFVPPPTFSLEPTTRPRGSMAPPRPPSSSSLGSLGARPSAVPPPLGPPSRPAPPPPPSASGIPDSRRPSASLSGVPSADGVSVAACAQLLDRLAASDESPFIAQWIEGVLAGRTRIDPTLAVRLLRAYRETGRIDRARDLAASLPSAPGSWNCLDAARLAVERAILATVDGRADHAEAELRNASRALAAAPRGAGHREQLDVHLTQAQLDLRLNRPHSAVQALRLAEHVAERLEDGAWHAPSAMTLGHLSMRLAEPRTAAKHYAAALARSPARSATAMSAAGNLAIALGSIGRFDEGRQHGTQAIAIARDIASGWRHADAYDVLAIVEIAADRPLAALQAIDEALVVLGDADHPMLRYQLAGHRTWALAMLGRAQAAKQWLAKTEKIRADVQLDAADEQDLVSTRARTMEASGQLREALDHALAHTEFLPEAFVTGSLNLVAGRCALTLGDEATARAAIERAALSGDIHGWLFPDRRASLALWQLALRSGDSRVVRYAERTIELVNKDDSSGVLPSSAPPSVQPPSARVPMPPSSREMVLHPEPLEGETLIYVTTPEGVSRIPLADLRKAVEGASLVVDTLAHALRVHDREVSLERRRALEPLVVQLLRRAREGLSAEEILRAAGGPGPESADAEHRVRVLISRVRDLLGDPSAIERVRDAGEYGRTRYRLAGNLQFALVEPLFSSLS